MSKFWHGPKRIAKKQMGNRMFNMLHRYGLPEVGGLTQDCDGFNHVISSVRKYYWGGPNQFEYEILKADGGGIVCPCNGVGWQPPASVEQIVAYFKSWDCPRGRKTIEEWNLTETTEMVQKLQRGEPICDARGLRL